MRGATAHLCTGMLPCTFGSPSPRPTRAAVRSVWWPAQVFALASPGGDGWANSLWLPCFEWPWTSWNGMTVIQLRTFFSWTCVLFFYFFSSVQFGFLQTPERNTNSKSMADNRENEGRNREPAGGEGRWPADNKLHNTYNNFIQVW